MDSAPERSSPDSSIDPVSAGSPTVSFKPTPVSLPESDRPDGLYVAGVLMLLVIGLADLAALVVLMLR
jgi:hypothetical protein